MPFLILLIVILSATVIFLSVKIGLLHRSMSEIREQIDDRLNGETSSSIRLTSSDKKMMGLADDLNKALDELQEAKNEVAAGSKDLRNNIASISHDIRTPLTAINSYTRMLEGDVTEEERQRYLSRIKERTEELKSLTTELYGYSMSCDPLYHSMISYEQIDIKRIIEDSLLSFFKEFNSRGIKPETVFPSKDVIITYNRKTAIRIFDNLFSNAAKYAADSFKVILYEDGTVVTENPAPDLTPVMVSKMFDKYYTVKDGKDASGLGMSIARDLVSEYGGDISAVIKNDEGNKLIITLKMLPVTNDKQHLFYGHEEAAKVHTDNNIYNGIKTPADLYDALSDIWCRETCAPRMQAEWTKENKTYGQCSITAFLVQDIFGGIVRGVTLEDGNYHCYNVVDDHVFDLTSEQFKEKLTYSPEDKVQTREEHFRKEEKRQRYEVLKERLSLSVKP